MESHEEFCGSHNLAAPQSWADALQAVELAASRWCSGNGNFFVDIVRANADAIVACKCHVCFTNTDCFVSIPDCIVGADELSSSSTFQNCITMIFVARISEIEC